MIVLHLISTLEGGGAERQLCMLAAEQASRGYDVHLAVRRNGIHSGEVRERGVQIHELGDLRGASPRLLIAIIRLIRTVRPLIVQTWLPQMDLLGGIAALWSNSSWILSERNSEMHYGEMPVVARLRLLVGQFASAIVANSCGGAEYWRRNVQCGPTLIIIPNALDVDRIRRAAAPGHSCNADQRPLLLAVGRFSREKAFDVVISAVAHLPLELRSAVKVLMMGEGDERIRLTAAIEMASLGDCIRLLPYQPDWWKWFSIADGLISMSRYEGRPNVVLEAMAAGCPVVLSDIAAHREIADACSALLVPVDGAEALAVAIKDVTADKAAARQRANRASERVASMTVPVMACAYDAVYDEVLNRKR
jgi:glycosyltransferase involved in cell wall biosynthesis